MALSNKTLKQGNFTTPQYPNEIIERYIIETNNDLSEFVKVFKLTRRQKVDFKQHISDKLTIILQDVNSSGFHSYCFSSKVKAVQHPSDFIRV